MLGGVCFWFVLGRRADQTEKGGRSDQSGKVLCVCFVDFNLKSRQHLEKNGPDSEQCGRKDARFREIFEKIGYF